MKHYFLLSALLSVFVLGTACSKSDAEKDAKKQDVKMYYFEEFKIVDRDPSDPAKLKNSGYVNPVALYEKIGEILLSYEEQYYHGVYDIRRATTVQCTYDTFEAAYQKGDAAAIVRQKKNAEQFQIYYKSKIEPLLNDKDTYGKGEFTVRVAITAERMEDNGTGEYKRYDGAGNLIEYFKYKPYGTINNITINGNVADPITFEIKYSNP